MTSFSELYNICLNSIHGIYLKYDIGILWDMDAETCSEGIQRFVVEYHLWKKQLCVEGGAGVGRSKIVQEALSDHVWDLVSLPVQQRGLKGRLLVRRVLC